MPPVALAAAVVIALYCRISIDKSGLREGVEAQEQWGREYAARQWPGATIRVFIDNNLSAARDDRRPGYEELRAAIRAGEITHVWAVEQSRLERRKGPWFDLVEEFLLHDVDVVHTRRDGLVRLDEIGSDVQAIVNANYVKDLKKKVRDKMETLAQEGRPPGAVVFGYTHGLDEQGRKALHVVEAQADAVRWAAGAFLSGWSLTAIADELTKRGFTGAQGKALRVGSIRSILSSATIAGRRVHKGVDIGPGNWTPILDMDTWQAARARLSSTRTIRRRDGRDHQISAATFAGNRRTTGRRYVLTGESGLSTCGVCGAHLTGCTLERAAGPTPYLKCQPRPTKDGLVGRGCVGIAMEPVERHVVHELFAQLDKPEFLAALAADDHAARRDELTSALTAIDGKRATLARMWAAGESTDDEWQEARAGLKAREDALRGELVALPSAPAQMAGIEGARDAWPDMTLDEKREFLRLFIERVEINPAPRPGVTDPAARVAIEWRTA